MSNKLIELWKNNCEHCEATKPILDELEKEGYRFDRFDVETPEGQKVWQEYSEIINNYNRSQGYDVDFVYTPTLVNPTTQQALSYPDRAPAKEEIVQLAKRENKHEKV